MSGSGHEDGSLFTQDFRVDDFLFADGEMEILCSSECSGDDTQCKKEGPAAGENS
jgi:hypothetical protein